MERAAMLVIGGGAAGAIARCALLGAGMDLEATRAARLIGDR